MSYFLHLEPYVAALQRSISYLLLIALLAAVLAYGIMRSVDPTYQVHMSYLVSLASREDANEYRFDGFYALQATDLFTATLARWMQTPETIVASFAEAGIELHTTSPRELVKIVRAEKTAPQLVEVTIRHTSAQQAQALAEGLKTTVLQSVDRYQDEGIPELTFQVVATDPWTGVTRPSTTLVTAATFLLILFVGVNIVLLLETIRRQDTSNS